MQYSPNPLPDFPYPAIHTFFFYWELFQYLNHQEQSFLLQNALKNKNKLLSLSVENGIFYLTQIILD